MLLALPEVTLSHLQVPFLPRKHIFPFPGDRDSLQHNWPFLHTVTKQLLSPLPTLPCCIYITNTLDSGALLRDSLMFLKISHSEETERKRGSRGGCGQAETGAVEKES